MLPEKPKQGVEEMTNVIKASTLAGVFVAVSLTSAMHATASEYCMGVFNEARLAVAGANTDSEDVTDALKIVAAGRNACVMGDYETANDKIVAALGSVKSIKQPMAVPAIARAN